MTITLRCLIGRYASGRSANALLAFPDLGILKYDVILENSGIIKSRSRTVIKSNIVFAEVLSNGVLFLLK